MFGSREKRAERLIERGQEASALFDAAGMVWHGRKLQKLRHSFGFELEARGHYLAARPERALEVLNQGIDRAPVAWRLHLTKAEMLIDLGRYDEADTTLEIARELSGAPLTEIACQRALIRLRRSQFEEALSLLPDLTDSADLTNLVVLEYRVAALLNLNRAEECRQLIERAAGFARDYTADEQRSRWLVCRARVEAVEQDPAAEATALEAARLDPSNEEACEILRRQRGIRSPDLRCWQVVAHVSKKADQSRGFYATFLCNAENLVQADADIREVLNLDDGDFFELDESGRFNATDEFRGVVRQEPGRTYYEGSE